MTLTLLMVFEKITAPTIKEIKVITEFTTDKT